MVENKHIRINVDERGFGKVFVNGIDISNAVQAIEFKTKAGEGPTTVSLHLISSVEIDATGLVQEVEPTKTDG